MKRGCLHQRLAMNSMDNTILLKNRKLLIALIYALCFFLGNAQDPVNANAGSKAQKTYSDHYYNRLALFEEENRVPGEIIFLGNSITEGGDWKALFPDKNVVNRGISGDVTDGILNRIEEVTASQPAKVFLLVGTNDMARGRSIDYVVEGTRAIVEAIRERSDQTTIYVQSILPVNPGVGQRFSGHKANHYKILEANVKLKALARELGIAYIDLHKRMRDRKGYLKAGFTHDGLHLKEEGYVRWKRVVKKHLK